MKNNLTKEILLSAVLIILTILLLNPFGFWMPDMMVMVMLVLTLIFFAFLATFVLREKIKDEREMFNRMFAGRIAFIAGTFILTLGIVVQAINHAVDKWLVAVFVAMVLGKILTRMYCDYKDVK